MANLKIMNYTYKKFDTGIPTEDIAYINIIVISGDELVDVYMKDGNSYHIDSADMANDPRHFDFYDGSYAVTAKYLERWSRRKTTGQFHESLIDEDMEVEE